MEIETENIINEIPLDQLRISNDSPHSERILVHHNHSFKSREPRTRRLWKFIKKPADINHLPTFQINHGLTQNLDFLATPSDFFSRIFDNRMIRDLLEYTNANANANQKIHYYKKLYNHKRLLKLVRSHEKKWKDVDELEMKAFIGIILYMGIISKPTIHEYWTKSYLFGTPGFRSIMSRDRFYQILKYFKLYKDNEINNQDPTYKFSSLMKNIIDNSQSLYIPDRNLTIDEAMVKFSGRSKMKVYMPLKPIKYGFKIFLLCESKTGFVLKWIMYTGRNSENVYSNKNVVLRLLEGYEGEGYSVYMDRFYTSPNILLALRKKLIGASGTVMKNRLNLPKEYFELIEKLQFSECVFISRKNLILTCWKDSKIVYHLSNCGNTNISETTRRTKKSKNPIETISIPQTIKEYNFNSKGVDLFDQLSSYYLNHRKSVKWYIPIFYHLIELAVINSHILYKNTKDPSISLLNFKKELVRGLISPIRKQKNILETNAKITLETNQTNVCRLALADKKKDCTLCKERKRGRIQSKYFCSRCHIHVCIIPCYDDHLASVPKKKLKLKNIIFLGENFEKKKILCKLFSPEGKS